MFQWLFSTPFCELYCTLSVFDSLFNFTEGSSIPQLTIPTIRQFLLPLPPLSEQKRIVAKIEELFALLDNIQNNIS
ncbi:MAG: restriction endonuclease subunit S [Treponema sp.]|nr:restriction endonuclease subunit S [Treponema sp.]